MGVPSISSNLTGFANYITSRVDEPSKSGIYIVDRRYHLFLFASSLRYLPLIDFVHTMKQCLKSLIACSVFVTCLDANVLRCAVYFSSQFMYSLLQLRNRTESLSSFLDWTLLGKQYIHAYKKAYATKFNENVHFGEIEI